MKNDHALEKRKKQIEEYLNYLNSHKYLSKNQIFLIFLSNDFDKYKNELNKKGGNIYEKFTQLKEYIPLLKSP
jgi:hypothetical protein